MTENRKQLSVDEFLEATLSQIVSGLIKFAENNKGNGANPNPPLLVQDTSTVGGFLFGQRDTDKNRNETIMPVDFDIAVTVQEAETGGRGMEIKVVSLFRADGSLATEIANTTVNRVRFRVPLRLPDTGADGKPKHYQQQYAITNADGF